MRLGRCCPSTDGRLENGYRCRTGHRQATRTLANARSWPLWPFWRSLLWSPKTGDSIKHSHLNPALDNQPLYEVEAIQFPAAVGHVRNIPARLPGGGLCIRLRPSSAPRRRKIRAMALTEGASAIPSSSNSRRIAASPLPEGLSRCPGPHLTLDVACPSASNTVRSSRCCSMTSRDRQTSRNSFFAEMASSSPKWGDCGFVELP